MYFRLGTDDVGRPNDLLTEAWRDVMLCGDLDAGIERMRFRGRTWLPQETAEELTPYTQRLERTELFPGFTSALDECVAQPFSKPVQVSGLAPELEKLTANVDGDGNDLTQFSKSMLRSAVKYGLACALVDYTATRQSDRILTRQDEAAIGPRPFWRLVERPDLIGWRTVTLPGGEMGFAEVRIHEIRTVPDGEYGEKKAEFVRVIRRDRYELWQNTAYAPPAYNDGLVRDARFYDVQESRPTAWVKLEEQPYGPPQGFASVPVVVLYSCYQGFMRAKPALLDLADTNLTHYRKKSDYDNLAHFAGVPILFQQGFEAQGAGGLAIGAGSMISTANPDARLSYVEHSGAALQVLREDLDATERRMEQMGVRPHVERTTGASATAAYLNATGAATDVQAWAQAADTVLEQLFRLSALWLGNPGLADDLDVQIYKDFAAPFTDSQLNALKADADAGYISTETYLRERKRRGGFGDDLDVEAEAGHAEQAKAAKAEAARQAMERAAQGAMPGPDAGNEPGAMPAQREAA